MAAQSPTIGATNSRDIKSNATISIPRSPLFTTKLVTTESPRTNCRKNCGRILCKKKQPRSFSSGAGLQINRKAELSRGSGCFLFDWRTDQVAPFGPRTVVIFHAVVAQEIFQNEPGVRTALANPAVRDHFILSCYAFAFVKRLQRFRRFERAIFIRRLNPRNIRCPWDVSAPLRGLRHPRRRDNFPGKLVAGSNVD